MGIEGIGKRGPVVPEAPAQDAVAAKRATNAEFEVKQPVVQSTVPAEGRAAALDELRAGRIDLAGYLDLKVQEATRHLQGLAPSELDSIRAALRERIAADPTLVDLVTAATGQVQQQGTHDD
jgi:hypothetical protein